MKQPEILIIGGGIAGLATATALAKRGLIPQVIERVDAWPRSGTGIYMPANGVRALRNLGLDRAVAERSFEITHQRFLNHRGVLLREIDLKDIWEKTGPCIAIHRSDLHESLVEVTSSIGPRMGITVASIRPKGEKIKVVFNDGESADFDMVVGADGMFSSVRRLIFDGQPPRFLGQVSWRFVANSPGSGFTT